VSNPWFMSSRGLCSIRSIGGLVNAPVCNTCSCGAWKHLF
jgi:hypothetical protein